MPATRMLFINRRRHAWCWYGCRRIIPPPVLSQGKIRRRSRALLHWRSRAASIPSNRVLIFGSTVGRVHGVEMRRGEECPVAGVVLVYLPVQVVGNRQVHHRGCGPIPVHPKSTPVRAFQRHLPLWHTRAAAGLGRELGLFTSDYVDCAYGETALAGTPIALAGRCEGISAKDDIHVAKSNSLIQEEEFRRGQEHGL